MELHKCKIVCIERDEVNFVINQDLTRHARNLSYADKTEESIVYLKETLSLLELCGAKETAIATCMIE